MDCKQLLRWHIVIDGDNCPKNKKIVVAIWIKGSETCAELAFYDSESKEWFSANPQTRGDALIEPDYWIETPLTEDDE